MKEESIFTICLTLVILSVVGAMSIYHLNDRKLMSENINKAIEKGVDPMSVRCSYANSQDLVCVAFAASTAPHNVQSPINKK